ncbi:hypothetical protein N9J65_06235, partial [Flavobacteriaceae bacterium]|nr:hypothetical protein [Flavobacteriaceae bacterium]
MKKKYFILLFMFSCLVLSAQSNVSINVTDATTTLPIEDAEVVLNSTTLLTDINGDVTFTNITDGTYGYTVTKLCYQNFLGS